MIFQELIDLSKKEPELLKRLINLWHKEARANNVLPLNDDLDGLYAKVAPKPRDFYRFFPNATRYNRLSAPDIYHHDFDIKVDIIVEHNSEGCIIASGDSAAGYEIFLKDGYMNFIYVYTREKIFRMKSKRKLRQGNHKIHFIGKVSGQGSAKVSMMMNGEIIGFTQSH
jgi:arylsulfatase